MFSFPEIKNDTDGKIYYEEDGKVVWVTEVPDYVQDSVALAFNQIIARVVEKFNSAHSPTNTGSPKLPPLEEVQKHAQAIHGSTGGELLAVYRAYEFIVGWQLRAGA